tara:strand:+ start:3620 stop:4294 length:675 start_codon:yes stop_codon:yes gene_type:complete
MSNKRWSKEEIDKLNTLLNNNVKQSTIAKELNRSITSVQLKIKRLKLKEGTYNEKHQLNKYLANKKYLDYLKPKSVLDVYAGSKSYYENKVDNLITNDINTDYKTNYNLNAFDLLCQLYLDKVTFDLIDLDPYGSAAENVYLATKLANKGLIVTYGELGHKKFKRLDYVSKFYNINTLDDFNLKNLINHTKLIAKQNKKVLEVHTAYMFYAGLGRVYYKVNEQT